MVAAAIAAFGRLDIVVANAASPQAASFHKLSLADFRAVFDVGFFGTLHLVHAAWPRLRDQGYGRVVMTSSSAGRSEEHTSELQSLMRISYAVFCLKKKKR